MHSASAFGLTPFPSPWIPPFQDAARSAREGLSAGKLPPTQPSVAERPSAPCTALRAARCKCRYGRLRAGRISRRGGLRPPASFKTSPLPRLDSLLGTVTRAGGGVRGGGGGRPRPFGLLAWRGREAARRDHRPQLVCELMTRDTRSVMKKPWFQRGIRVCGGWGFSPTTTYTVLFSGQAAFSSPC